jgi:hypothetical protein
MLTHTDIKCGINIQILTSKQTLANTQIADTFFTNSKKIKFQYNGNQLYCKQPHHCLKKNTVEMAYGIALVTTLLEL